MENSKKEHSGVLTMKGNWQNQSTELKKKFSNLTDSDLKFEKGAEEDLIKRVGDKLGKSKEEVITMITKGQN